MGTSRVLEDSAGGNPREGWISGEGLNQGFDALPFTALQRRFGHEASGTEIEDLGIVAVEREAAWLVAAVASDVGEQLIELELVVGVALELLEGDALVPDQADAAAIDSDGLLGVVAPFRIPLRVRAGWIVPLHDQRFVASLLVEGHQAGAVGLLIDQSNAWLEAEDVLVGLHAETQIGAVYSSRYQGPNQLGVATADELAGAVMDQIPQLADPAGIDLLNELQRAGRCFDAKGQPVLAGQAQQGPIAALHDLGALFFFY